MGSQGLDPPPLQPSPHLEYLSSSGCGPYLTPILTQCYSQLTSYSLHITGMCVLLVPLLFACPLLFGFCFLLG